MIEKIKTISLYKDATPKPYPVTKPLLSLPPQGHIGLRVRCEKKQRRSASVMGGLGVGEAGGD